MSFDYSKLRGKIIELFGTQSKFANKIKLSGHSLSNKLNNRCDWTNSEIIRVAEALQISKEEIPDYFFNNKVQY